MLYNFAEFVEIHKMQNLKHLFQKQKEELCKFHLETQIIEFLMGIDKMKGCFRIGGWWWWFGFFWRK